MRESSSDSDEFVEWHSKKTTLADHAIGMIYSHVPTRILSGRAMLRQRDHNALIALEEKRSDCTLCETDVSTTDEDDFTGWAPELQRVCEDSISFGRVTTHQERFVKKKWKRKENRECTRTVIPAPIPQGWAHVISPYTKVEAWDGECTCDGPCKYTACRQLKADLRNFNHSLLGSCAKFSGIYVNCDWGSEFCLADFQHMQLGELMDAGMLFIWVPIECSLEVIRAARSMGFELKDTLTWIKKHVNNRITQKHGYFFMESKETLYLFRRVDKQGRNTHFELRHQRSSDTFFGFLRFDPSLFPPLLFVTVFLCSVEPEKEIRPHEHILDVMEKMIAGEHRQFLFLYLCSLPWHKCRCTHD